MASLLSKADGTHRSSPFRLGVREALLVVACCAVLLWAVRKISDNLRPVRVVARNVEYGMKLDRQGAVEMLSQASGAEIDVALPALLKLQASAGPDDHGKILAGMTGLLIERFTPWTRGSAPPLPPVPESTAGQARAVIDALCTGLTSSDDATRIQAAQSFRTILKAEAILNVIAPWRGRAGLVDADAVIRSLETALGDPLAEVRMEAAQALGNLAAAVDHEPPPVLRRALRDPSPVVRNAAALAVAGFENGLDPCLADLFRAMEDSQRQNVNYDGSSHMVLSHCFSAVLLAGATPAAGTASLLSAALDSPCSEVRGIAATFLGRIGPDARAAVPALVGALRRTLGFRADRFPLHSWEVREIAAAIQKIDPHGPVITRDLVPVLIEAVRLRGLRFARSDAIEALQHLGPLAEPAVPALIEVMNQRTEEGGNAEEAAAALVQIGRGTPSAGRVRAALADAFKKRLIRRELARQLEPADPLPSRLE
jgi:HEAT repeat protein